MLEPEKDFPPEVAALLEYMVKQGGEKCEAAQYCGAYHGTPFLVQVMIGDTALSGIKAIQAIQQIESDMKLRAAEPANKLDA